MDLRVVEPARSSGRTRHDPVPPLENGAHLSAAQFLRRYESMPEVKKAELIGGIVCMGSPVRAYQHGDPDSLIQTWLGSYAVATPGVKSTTNSTLRLGVGDVLQPDGALRILPECGGRVRVDPKGYLLGGPELVVEVAASNVSVDVREKLLSYRRAGCREYVVFRTEDQALDWWILVEDEYRPLAPDAQGILQSRTFPGLWLDSAALVALDGVRMMAVLRTGLEHPDHAAFVARLAGARSA